MGRPLDMPLQAWAGTTDTGLRRRKADLMEDEPRVPPHAGAIATDREGLLQLMLRLQRCAGEWQVQPGCEVQIDLRHALMAAAWSNAVRH